MMEKYKDTITRIKPIAESFINKHSLIHPLVNSLQTASELGYYLIKAEAPQNLSGFYIKKYEYPFIFVNSTHSLGRQNFSLWHEVYHHHMDHESGISDFNSKSIQEREAEIFAGCIMLPDEEIYKVIEDKIDGATIARISHKYQMSFKAVIVRLMQEKYINYQEFVDLKALSAQDNSQELISLYEGEGLPVEILLPTRNIQISANIMNVLKSNYDQDKITDENLNVIIQRIEGLKYV